MRYRFHSTLPSIKAGIPFNKKQMFQDNYNLNSTSATLSLGTHDAEIEFSPVMPTININSLRIH